MRMYSCSVIGAKWKSLAWVHAPAFDEACVKKIALNCSLHIYLFILFYFFACLYVFRSFVYLAMVHGIHGTS